MTLDQELEIVEKAKEDLSAFDQIYSFYFNRVYGYCFKRTSNHSITEEIVSQVFLKAVENIKKFDTKKQVRFGSWLYTTAHNLIIDFFRATKKYTSFENWQIETTDNLEHQLSVSEYQKQVAFVMTKLKPRYQKVLSLRFFSELELSEIAKIMKTSNKNISVVLYRAGKDFEKKYRKIFPESEIFE
ncbi:sigma-70 family RNA polymerase sigma factor [Candidatus Dojkabacteria bacterium]|uniref:Sigma-70 family RNA polymerase sigma factor n=1 Tax=Candidatus Dojkabacteria bacterium TaxID=2099670 RepID=A0A955L9D5_9BACT|nr:sigma-70 family RNA polymerase sigma factor [Candidatus Dojkabacteria bacterium]